jgi:hypothetical protein
MITIFCVAGDGEKLFDIALGNGNSSSYCRMYFVNTVLQIVVSRSQFYY